MEHRPKDDQQALRAIDPGSLVQNGAVTPEAGHLGVPALVRGQGGVQEGQAGEHGEQHGGGEGRWGPPRRNVDRPTAVLAAVAFAVALLAQLHVRRLAYAGPLRPGAAGSRARARAGPPVPARFRPLRGADRALRGVSRNRAHPAPQSLLPAAARRREVPLLRPRPHRRPAGLAVDREPALVRPVPLVHDPGALHRAADARVLPVAEAAGALLPVRRNAARALLRRRAHVLALSGGAASGPRPTRG